VRFLEEGGPVLGPLPATAYERGVVQVAPGDLVVLYTDGITEARGAAPGEPTDEHGLDRLIAICRDNRHRPAPEIVAAVFDSLDRFTNGRAATDDRTVLVVRRPAGE
jgi:sigma-B regulation protein RsbU (phosphoserine phosphatase)